MLAKSRRFILPAALGAALILGGAHETALAQAQAAQTGQPQKNWKDRAEYDLYESITKQTDPQQKLALINQWKEKYPSSEFADVRNALYLQSLGAVVAAVYTLPQNATPEQLSNIDKAANEILTNADQLFAADRKPAGVSDADWATAKKSLTVNAQNALGLIAMRNKQNDKAEEAFRKSLQMEPNSGQVSYWLGTVILAQKDPAKQSEALYDFARAAAYDGPGALAPAGRQEVQKYLEKAYESYHGSKEGLDALMAQAKTSAVPPADFKVTSKVDLAKAKIEQEEKLRQENPQLALWKSIKTELTGANAQAYFNEHMKDTLLPKFSGKLISATPENRPKQLVLSVEDGTTPDATLNLDAPLVGKMDPGAEIGFEGTATGYTASPYMVTFDVEKAKLTGWKGAPPPKPAATKKAPVHRKKK